MCSICNSAVSRTRGRPLDVKWLEQTLKADAINSRLYNYFEMLATMTPTEKLLAWHRRWILSQATVKCRFCREIQAEEHRAEVFPHKSWCTGSVSATHPWLELDEIRDAISPNF